MASLSRSSARWPNSCSTRGAQLEVGDLVRRDGDVELAGGLELGVDPVAPEVGAELLVVAHPEALDRADLVREAPAAVLDSVGQRVVEEAAVAGAGAGAAARRLEHDDLALGRELLGVERGPEPREATADDQQVAVDRLLERLVRLAPGSVCGQ